MSLGFVRIMTLVPFRDPHFRGAILTTVFGSDLKGLGKSNPGVVPTTTFPIPKKSSEYVYVSRLTKGRHSESHGSTPTPVRKRTLSERNKGVDRKQTTEL